MLRRHGARSDLIPDRFIPPRAIHIISTMPSAFVWGFVDGRVVRGAQLSGAAFVSITAHAGWNPAAVSSHSPQQADCLNVQEQQHGPSTATSTGWDHELHLGPAGRVVCRGRKAHGQVDPWALDAMYIDHWCTPRALEGIIIIQVAAGDEGGGRSNLGTAWSWWWYHSVPLGREAL